MFQNTLFTLAAAGFLVAAPSANSLTFVLNFDPSQDVYGRAMGAFDPSVYGFDTPLPDIPDLILEAVTESYTGYPTSFMDPLSPLVPNTELDIDFVLGTMDALPSNGDDDYFHVGIGTGGTSNYGSAYLGVARGGSISFDSGANVASIYTDVIGTLAGLASTQIERINLIAGTIAHEIGHTLNLLHPDGIQDNPGESAYGTMATGSAPTRMPDSERILTREFAYDDFGILIENVGTRSVATVAAVPLPAPLPLLAGSVLVLGMIRTRRRAV